MVKFQVRGNYLTAIGMYIRFALAGSGKIPEDEIVASGTLPDLPESPQLQEAKEAGKAAENEKLRLIRAARDGTENIHMAVFSMSLWTRLEMLPHVPEDLRKDFRHWMNVVVAHGIPTLPPCTAAIVVNISEIFSLVSQSLPENLRGATELSPKSGTTGQPHCSEGAQP